MSKLTEEELTMHKLLGEHKYALLPEKGTGNRSARCVICNKVASESVRSRLQIEASEAAVYSGLVSADSTSDGPVLTKEAVEAACEALWDR